MELTCTPCRRTFNSNNALKQHLAENSAHRPGKASKTSKPPRPPRTDLGSTSESISTLLFARLCAAVHTEELLRLSSYVTTTPMISKPREIVLQDIRQRACSRCKRTNTKPQQSCRYHFGRKNRFPPFQWSCCTGQPDTPRAGCQQAPRHVFRIEGAADLHAIHPFSTSQPNPDTLQPSKTIQKAIALDCEMAYTTSGLEVVSLAIISVPSGATLYNSLVKPDFELIDDNFRFSGVRSSDISAARRDGTCLFGIDGARSMVLEFVDRDTIVVGHGLAHDLKKLRLIHHRVLDTSLLYSGPGLKTPSLESLARTYLGLEIRSDAEAKGHNGVEDAVVAMRLCLSYVDLLGKEISSVGIETEEAGPSVIMNPAPLLVPSKKKKKKRNNNTARFRQERGSNTDMGFGQLSLNDDLDYSLCDKDCGWCGKCIYGYSGWGL